MAGRKARISPEYDFDKNINNIDKEAVATISPTVFESNWMVNVFIKYFVAPIDKRHVFRQTFHTFPPNASGKKCHYFNLDCPLVAYISNTNVL